MRRELYQLPPGIEAAALRFAKACQRDGHGEHLCCVRVIDGQVVYLDLFDNSGKQHFLVHEHGNYYEVIDEGELYGEVD